MSENRDTKSERLKAKIAELEELIARWERPYDPESKWMLYLLREALEMGRIQLTRTEGGDA